MIKKYGKVIIEEERITICDFEFDCEEYGEPYIEEAQFDAVNWAQQRLNGKSSREIEKSGK